MLEEKRLYDMLVKVKSKGDFLTENCEFDWIHFLELIVENRIFLLIYQKIYNYIPKDFCNIYNRNKAYIINMIKMEKNMLKEVTEYAHVEKIRFVVLKGLPLSNFLYSNIYARQVNDIDILVEEDDFSHMDYLLRTMGFDQILNVKDWDKRQFELLNYPIMRLRATNHLFEYIKFLPDNDIYVKIEVHKRIWGIDDDKISEFFWHTQEIDIDGTKITTFDELHTLIFLFLNCYQNTQSSYAIQGKITLRDFVDIHTMLQKYEGKYDWNILKKHANRLKIEQYIAAVARDLYDFYQDQLTYDFMLMFSEVTDVRIDLHMSVWEKYFDSEKRRQRYIELQREKVFGKKEFRTVFPERKNKLDIFDYPLIKNIYRLPIRYGISYSREGLTFSIYVPQVMTCFLECYMFQFTLYENRRDFKELYKLIELRKDSNEYLCEVFSSPITRDANVIRKAGRRTLIKADLSVISGDYSRLSVTLSKEDLHIAVLKETDQFACKVNAFKYMAHDTYHHLEETSDEIYDAVPLKLANYSIKN